MIDGQDICMPALWCNDKTVIAYSREGSASKAWPLPPDWQQVRSVVIARITFEGMECKGSVAVEDGRLALSLEPGEAMRICES